MKRVKSPKILLLLLLFLSASAVGIKAFDSEQVYSALEKAFYLSAEDAVWIRPGLKIQILDVSIPADRRPVAKIQVLDGAGQPLDRTGVVTPGSVSISFLIGCLPKNSNQYWSYATRTVTSPITKVTEKQAGADSGGVWTDMGDGMYSYRFGTTLPADYDTSVTHTVGIYASRNLAEFGMSRYVSNVIKNFVPDGSAVTKIREVVPTAACNQCHNPLALHGSTGRQNVEICIMCHQPQTIDPDTGETVDLKVMVHKIHRGANLPSVQAGKPYKIIGNAQSVHDYSNIHYPQDIRNCDTCHQNAAQVNNWLLNPTRATCGSCHDNVNFQTGENHAAGAQPDDKFCANCHWPESGQESDASIRGAHTVPYKSSQLVGPVIEILDIANTAAGQNPTVRFKLTDKNGQIISPAKMSRLTLRLAGPTSDYRWNLGETATAAAMGEDGVASYTFKGALPADAKGSYALQAEGRISVTLNAGTTKQATTNDGLTNKLTYFSVDGSAVKPRREIVDIDKCNKCHEKLQFHGGNRNQAQACVVCHNPAMTVNAGEGQPRETVSFQVMIHRLHTGAELNNEYLEFNEVHYPGDRRDCLQCHKTGTYTVPLASGTTAVETPGWFWSPTSPTAAACLGCHDSVEAAAHAFLNTASFGESCAVCHKEGAEFAVSKVHAR
jgi:OmcA/MtrC family decaheme c-type cytochrome